VTIEWLTYTPISTLFIMLVAFGVSLATSTTNRLLTKRDQLRDWNREISQWRSESMKAARAGDKKLMAKLKKQEKHVMQLQSKMMWQSMKTSFLWFIPLMLMWYVLLPAAIEPGTVVALLPWLGSEPYKLNVFMWYLFCSFLAGIIFNRLFGLGMGGE
jgi:uncharacterized membrane protein (DUF106 family)